MVEKKYLDSGVKKVQVLAIAPSLPESYVNMKRLWLEAAIDRMFSQIYFFKNYCNNSNPRSTKESKHSTTRSVHDCSLTCRCMLENFPPYMRTKGEELNPLLREMNELRHKKGRQKYSTNMIR